MFPGWSQLSKPSPQSCPQKHLHAGLQSSPLPSSPLLQLPNPLLQPDLRPHPAPRLLSAYACSLHSPEHQTKVPFGPHTLNQEPHCQDFFKISLIRKLCRGRTDQSIAGTVSGGSFSRAGIKIKNDENEKKKKLSQNWKRRQSPSYSNENARHHLFCSFIHQTCINSAGDLGQVLLSNRPDWIVKLWNSSLLARFMSV